MKKEIRANILQQKSLISDEVVNNTSISIFNILSQQNFYKKANNIMLYISFGKEVVTKYIIEDLQKSGKRVFIPVTVPKTKALIVSELKDFEKDLQVGHFGVMEPKEEALRPVDPSILDLVIVPGVAFDQSGYRIGYGGGYYDRFIPRLSAHATTVSLAFDMQLIDKVPTSQYDIPVQYIITEKQLIQCL
ncbi:5-formyltetrahydrofolate cyclo-ligase [Alkaliphilus oremlandii]|uniref:5-formyltetrahydrofolate cyclo-ligase n=1 Tax=Alkaliphilus oremlandii (strain OhILAs) TaxID=350688 RepID=A8MJ14_ALKOO|nr:5-formyltetrahydrofolate cyclo-ligase [Alkaliphilus oremlandii]ABW19796.1 5-formyltetrahydrofolate cyclo-ligase [Alkaliphilus oremlandii OhILAs]